MVKPCEERFPGAHALGWFMAVISILMMLGAIVIGAVAGIQEGYGFVRLFVRFFIMLLLLNIIAFPFVLAIIAWICTLF